VDAAGQSAASCANHPFLSEKQPSIHTNTCCCASAASHDLADTIRARSTHASAFRELQPSDPIQKSFWCRSRYLVGAEHRLGACCGISDTATNVARAHPTCTTRTAVQGTPAAEQGTCASDPSIHPSIHRSIHPSQRRRRCRWCRCHPPSHRTRGCRGCGAQRYGARRANALGYRRRSLFLVCVEVVVSLVKPGLDGSWRVR